MSKVGTLGLYDITLPNGRVVEMRACSEKSARRIAAEYWLIPSDERMDMQSEFRGLVKDLPPDVIQDCESLSCVS